MRLIAVVGFVVVILVAGYSLVSMDPPAVQSADATAEPTADPALETPPILSVAPTPQTVSEPALQEAVDRPERVELEESSSEPETETAEAALPVPRGNVLLFQHAFHDGSFPGAIGYASAGTTNAGSAFADNDVSAVRVPIGMQITLFADRDATGARIRLGPGDHNLAPRGFNDKASSVRVGREGEVLDLPVGPSHAVLVYEHQAWPGSDPGRVWSFGVAPGETQVYSAKEGFFANDTATAVWVPPGFEAIVFDTPDGEGLAVVLPPGFHPLDVRGFDNRTSSIRVSRGR